MTDLRKLERDLADALWPKSGSWQLAPVDADGDVVRTTLTLVVDAGVTRYEVEMKVREAPAKRGVVDGSRAVASAVVSGWRALDVTVPEAEMTVRHMVAHKAGDPVPANVRDRVISYTGPQRHTAAATTPVPPQQAAPVAQPTQPRAAERTTPRAPVEVWTATMRDVVTQTWNANADLLPAYRQERVKAAISSTASHGHPRPGNVSWGYPQATWLAVFEAAVFALVAVPRGGDFIGVLLFTAVAAVPGYSIAHQREEAARGALNDWEAANWQRQREGLAMLEQLEARAAVAEAARREQLRATWKYDRQLDREVAWLPDGPHPDPLDTELHWRDGEELAASWARWLGARHVVVTQATRDGGVDVAAEGVAISVKTFDKTPTVGSSVVQQIAGAANGRLPIIMSTARFTAPAVAEADRIGVALLRMVPREGTLLAESQLGRTFRERGLTPE